MQRYFEVNENNCNIRCKIYFNDLKNIKKVVLFGHGFGGHKDNKAAERFADRILTKYKNIALVTFNWPCHGDDVKKKLCLVDCETYLSLVVNHIKTKYETDQIYYYGTSFGGYLVLKYISENENPFVKIALRCPAIKMHQTMRNAVIKNNELELLEKGKDVPVGFDRKIMINQSFLTELENADISTRDYIDFADDLFIIHGTKDEIVPLDFSKEFCENNVIEFLPIENADHRFQNLSHMEAAIKSIIEFFQF